MQSLEKLITQAEDEGRLRIAKLKEENDETVADLECMVAAETRGRQEAEVESDQRNERVKALEGDLAQAKEKHEKEVGALNARLAEVHENLSSARKVIANMEAERKRLVKLVDRERKAGVEAVQAVREELNRLNEVTEGIGAGYVKGAKERSEVVVQKGLLTPTIETGRFRDVASEGCGGEVTMHRGKAKKGKKVDNGVRSRPILEEDEVF